MKFSLNSRRNFLGSLAILSAGSALGSVSSLLQTTDDNIENQWKKLCKISDAKAFHVFPSAEITEYFKPCKGHYYRSGQPVLFSDHQLIAIPTWISWGREKATPDDVIINFFRKDSQQKVGSINYFELAAIVSSLPDTKSNPMSFINDVLVKERTDKNQSILKIKTRIQRDCAPMIQMTIAGKQTIINKSFLFYA